MSHLAIGWRLARRELRGGVKGLRIVLACLALGVAAIAAVGTLRAATEAGLTADGARLLGGDMAIATSQRDIGEPAHEWLRARGARTSDLVSMRAMAVAPSGDRTLVELRAVDAAYPLIGELVLDPPGPFGGGANGLPPVALEPVTASRLGLTPGDVVRIGEGRFAYRGAIASEPDKAAGAALFGSRAIIPASALAATALVQPGSLVNYETRVTLPPGTDAAAFARDLRAQPFADGGWRIRLSSQGQPGVNRFLDQAASFLTLAGLTALLVGGIGVATGVRSWLDQRARTIATLRCLGAPAGAIFATYLIQVMVLALAGIAIGLVAGYGLTWAAAYFWRTRCPSPRASASTPCRSAPPRSTASSPRSPSRSGPSAARGKSRAPPSSATPSSPRAAGRAWRSWQPTPPPSPPSSRSWSSLPSARSSRFPSAPPPLPPLPSSAAQLGP
ncbi:ABC transporter permease [Roseomonas sp. CCTCC AB2023176]|uniref:ABC transporter permease n=1 Tax=Roseomonas sp. CCTCC AB2023176 TaxID=3342640 RepID=UPI0035D59E4F